MTIFDTVNMSFGFRAFFFFLLGWFSVDVCSFVRQMYQSHKSS